MELSSRFVGTPLKDYNKRITWREIMNYAASVEDNNPHYFDDERADGILAPPMLSVAVTWPILERIWEFIEAEDFPTSVMMTQVHYTEYLAFHRPIKPDDSLTIKGKLTAILPHRAGTQVVIRFDAVDKEGTPVFTEHTGALMRGIKCADEGLGEDSLPFVPSFADEGRLEWTAVVPIDPLRPFIYDGCTNIVFPIHTSKRFAHQVGLPDTILQGTATLAYAAREIVNREADGNPLKLKALFGRFTGMVLPGTAIHVRLLGRVPHNREIGLHFVVVNEEGQKAISKGYACLKNPHW